MNIERFQKNYRQNEPRCQAQSYIEFRISFNGDPNGQNFKPLLGMDSEIKQAVESTC